MTNVRVGVIGVGRLGSYFSDVLNTTIYGAAVTAIYARTKAKLVTVQKKHPTIQIFDTAEELIYSDKVDAILIATPNEAHYQYVKHSIQAGKAIFCEKPLANQVEQCLEIARLEMKHGKRLVQLGFMRRFDSAHIEMREEIKQKKIGIPLMIQAMHRNPYLLNPSSEIFEIMNDSAIHSIDFFQWLLEDSFSSVRVFQPPLHPNKQAYENPFLIVFETNRGVLISSELFLNCKYGFDSGCEVIGTEGTLTVKPLKQIKKKLVHHNGENQRWYGRYEKAFQQELQYWINGIKGNAISGPSAWDGYKATLVAKACAVATELNGEKVTIRVEDTPSFYLNR